MLRPEVYSQSYVAIRPTPYLCGETASPGSPGGVLRRGQTVWTRETPKGYPGSAPVYVDGIGIVSLDTRWLVRADVLKPVAQDGVWQSQQAEAS